MTAAEFSSLVGAKRTGRGKWIARCPSHKDKHPSLSIAEGRKHPVVFRCMSAGCTQEEVLRAMGLTWKQLLGERPEMTREARTKARDERELFLLKDIRRLMVVDTYLSFPEIEISQDTVEGWDEISLQIRTIEERLNPELKVIRLRSEKTYRFVKKWGWDRLWEIYLERNPL